MRPLRNVQRVSCIVDALQFSVCHNYIRAIRQRRSQKDCQCRACDWAFTCRKTSILLILLANCAAGEKTTFYRRALAKLIALLFATRAREPLPLRCFGPSSRNKHLPHSVNLPPKTSAHPHAYIANTSWRLVYSKRTPRQARDHAPTNPLRWKINHI